DSRSSTPRRTRWRGCAACRRNRRSRSMEDSTPTRSPASPRQGRPCSSPVRPCSAIASPRRPIGGSRPPPAPSSERRARLPSARLVGGGEAGLDLLWRAWLDDVLGAHLGAAVQQVEETAEEGRRAREPDLDPPELLQHREQVP